MPAPPVFVVHDEAETRELAVRALSAAGHVAVGFADPMKALDAIEADSRVRVLVTRVDFGPGKLNGLALARMARVKRPGTKCVFVALPENHLHVDGQGEILPIPLDPPTLVGVVGRLLAASTD